MGVGPAPLKELALEGGLEPLTPSYHLLVKVVTFIAPLVLVLMKLVRLLIPRLNMEFHMIRFSLSAL